MPDPQMWLEHDRCHCGRPLLTDTDGVTRGMCARCDLVRCDAYPGACEAPGWDQNAATPMLRIDGPQPPQPDGGVIVWVIAALIVAAVVAVFVVRF